MKVEDVVAAQADGGRRGERFREANHAHIVGVLLDARGAASVETRQTFPFAPNPAAEMTARMSPKTSLFRVRTAFGVRADRARNRRQQGRRGSGSW